MRLILLALVAAALALPVRAEEKSTVPEKASWSVFFKNLKSALAQSAVGGQQKKARSATGVAAVRGEEQDKKNIADPNEPGLKGDVKEARARKTRALNDELAASIELISKGKPDEGLKGLEAFKAAHPKHMAEDVNKAIEGAKAMIAEKGAGSDQE